MQTQKILSFPELKTAKGIFYSRSQIDRKEAAGEFPRRVRLGPNRVGFLECEIDAWIAGLVAERDDPERLEAELLAADAALHELNDRAELARERSHPGPRPAEIKRAEKRVAAARKALSDAGSKRAA